jgi:hypothetical protein
VLSRTLKMRKHSLVGSVPKRFRHFGKKTSFSNWFDHRRRSVRTYSTEYNNSGVHVERFVTFPTCVSRLTTFRTFPVPVMTSSKRGRFRTCKKRSVNFEPPPKKLGAENRKSGSCRHIVFISDSNATVRVSPGRFLTSLEIPPILP